MTPRRLVPAILLFGLLAGATARAQQVLHINAEMVRQRTTTGIHNRGFRDVGRYLRARGLRVHTLRVDELRVYGKTRIDFAKTGRPDLVTISATMGQSRKTTRAIIEGLIAQGFAPDRIIVGGQAISPEHAAKWGVRTASDPAALGRLLGLDGIVAQASK